MILRLEEQTPNLRLMPKDGFHHLDSTSLPNDVWRASARSEYTGAATSQAPPFSLRLRRTRGQFSPDDLILSCATKTLVVHPAFATLVQGWKNLDDTMEPASWAPPRTERIQALVCAPSGEHELRSRANGGGLAFARPRNATVKNLATEGVEWAFVNSDNVIQEGGYRWIPNFASVP